MTFAFGNKNRQRQMMMMMRQAFRTLVLLQPLLHTWRTVVATQVSSSKGFMAPRRVLDVTADGDAVGAEGWNHPMAPDDESAAFLMFATGQQAGAVARASEATALGSRLQQRPTPLRKGSRPGSECPEQLEDLRAHLCVNGFRHAEAESNTRWQRFLVWRVRADPFLLALDKFWKDNSDEVKAVVRRKCGGMKGLVEMEKQEKANNMKRKNAFVVNHAIELFDAISVEMAKKAVRWSNVMGKYNSYSAKMRLLRRAEYLARPEGVCNGVDQIAHGGWVLLPIFFPDRAVNEMKTKFHEALKDHDGTARWATTGDVARDATNRNEKGYIAWRSVDPTAHQIAQDQFIGTPDGEPADGQSLCATLDGLCWSSQGRLKKAKSYIRNMQHDWMTQRLTALAKEGQAWTSSVLSVAGIENLLGRNFVGDVLQLTTNEFVNKKQIEADNNRIREAKHCGCLMERQDEIDAFGSGYRYSKVVFSQPLHWPDAVKTFLYTKQEQPILGTAKNEQFPSFEFMDESELEKRHPNFAGFSRHEVKALGWLNPAEMAPKSKADAQTSCHSLFEHFS